MDSNNQDENINIDPKDKYIDIASRYGTAWIGHGKLAMKLVETFKPKVIVDLGVDRGFSTFSFAYHNVDGIVYGVDLHIQELLYELHNELKNEYPISELVFIEGFFNDVAKNWNKSIDFLHIDGDHSYESVSNDFNTWSKFCHDKSLIMFHDIELFFSGTVGKFFDEQEGWYKIRHTGSFGLGILTKSKEMYDEIENIINNNLYN